MDGEARGSVHVKLGVSQSTPTHSDSRFSNSIHEQEKDSGSMRPTRSIPWVRVAPRWTGRGAARPRNTRGRKRPRDVILKERLSDSEALHHRYFGYSDQNV
ncbi:hypothetical protein E2C01_015250 [Portunus trituberculatus]|uniref:Uncharacterized protein n=1 Tax=Portunus trituberculatus TaxID=210409 RepID=A0A5B7DL61_PORTR|nr:hypothetical protein [Portunus trituberculatus]